MNPTNPNQKQELVALIINALKEGKSNFVPQGIVTTDGNVEIIVQDSRDHKHFQILIKDLDTTH